MLSFEPLYQTIRDKGMKISELRGVLSPDTIANINKAHMTKKPKIYLATIETICLTLDVPINKVVEILPDNED